MIDGLPKDRPVIAWYGDDFTGAAGVLEALTFGGLPSVLFLDVPTPQQLGRFRGYGGIGIAGVARAKSLEWMDAALPPIFRFLNGLSAAITQYKVCSTFDSSPSIGSIGRAYDLAAPILGGAWTPLLVAVPGMNRFQVFGNLFASVAGVGYRLDRHPTMSRHPVTPMTEADLGVHLSRQTDASIGLIDVVTIRRGGGQWALDAALVRGNAIVSLDVADTDTEVEAGRLIWENRGPRLFAIGSQGLEYALLAYWHQAGKLAAAVQPPRADAVERVAAVSGSCSPLTAEQIAQAEKSGFRPIRLDVRKAVADRATWNSEINRAIESSLAAVSAGNDPLVYTARGPDDPSIAGLAEAIDASGTQASVANAAVGEGLGKVLAEILRRANIKRGIIAGGDTSSYATTELGVYALTAIAPTVPGAALFKAHSDNAQRHSLQIALKGGQMGSVDYFERIKRGG